jgi:hypothetical protein
MSRNIPHKPPEWMLARIRSDLSYDPDTGVVTWVRCFAKRRKPGDRAGSVTKKGATAYRVIGLGSSQGARLTLEHHIVWYLMTGHWPHFQIDHKDRDGTNNKWNNIRPATESQQQINRGLSNRNTSGARGVYYNKAANKYQTTICVNRQRIYLGLFPDLYGAAEAYESAAQRYFDPEFRVQSCK